MDILRLLPKDAYDAAVGANSPSASNVFATVADTLYGGDGTLAGNRVITGGGNDITWNGLGTSTHNTVNFSVNATASAGMTSSGAGAVALENTGSGNVTLSVNTGSIELQGISYPKIDGGINHVMKTDGAGNLAFVDVNTLVTSSNIYTADGAIPAATTRTATIADNSVLTFTAPTFGTILSLDGASGKVTIPGLLDPIGLQLTVEAANPGNANTLWANSTDSDRPYWGGANKIAFISDLDGNGIYGGSGTVPTSVTATLTDDLTISGSGVANADSLVFMHNSTTGITTGRALRLLINGVNSTNTALFITAANATAANRAIEITSGSIFQSAEEVFNVFGYNVPAHLAGTVSVGMNNSSTQDRNYDSLLNKSTTGTWYGYRSRNFSGAGGTGGTVYGYHANLITADSTTHGGYFQVTAAANARDNFGCSGIAIINTGITHTGTAYGGDFAAFVSGTGVGNDLVAARARTAMGAAGMTADNMTNLLVTGSVSNGSTLNNDMIGVDMTLTNAGTVSGDIVGLDVTVTNTGTLTGSIVAATFTGGVVKSTDEDFETESSTKGYVVLDRTNATRYRIYTDGGVLHTETA